ncbi:MAG: hypothetical protein V1773_13545 [bacterium]
MLKFIINVLFGLLIFINVSYAQYEFSYSGYAANIPIYQQSNQKLSQLFGINQNTFINLTRLRLRGALTLWSNARINSEYEISALYFSSEGNFSLVSENKTNRQILDLKWAYNNKNNNIVHFIDRLTFRQGFESGNITIGRQRISWGTGRVWNPTDLFNPINPMAYYKPEKDGTDAVSITYALDNFTDINMVYNPQEKLNTGNYGLRFRTNYNGYDVSLIGGYFDSRVIGGFDFAGNLLEAGIRAEGIISADKNKIDDNYIKLILGIDQQFSSKLYGMVEYYFNGQGEMEKQNYKLDKLFTGEIINLNRNYICTLISYQVTSLFTTSLTNNINLNDGSGYIGGTGNYSFTENLFFTFGMQLTYGLENSEYWHSPNSIYLQVEYYF